MTNKPSSIASSQVVVMEEEKRVVGTGGYIMQVTTISSIGGHISTLLDSSNLIGVSKYISRLKIGYIYTIMAGDDSYLIDKSEKCYEWLTIKWGWRCNEGRVSL